MWGRRFWRSRSGQACPHRPREDAARAQRCATSSSGATGSRAGGRERRAGRVHRARIRESARVVLGGSSGWKAPPGRRPGPGLRGRPGASDRLRSMIFDVLAATGWSPVLTLERETIDLGSCWAPVARSFFAARRKVSLTTDLPRGSPAGSGQDGASAGVRERHRQRIRYTSGRPHRHLRNARRVLISNDGPPVRFRTAAGSSNLHAWR